jgi:hypothetical protein
MLIKIYKWLICKSICRKLQIFFKIANSKVIYYVVFLYPNKRVAELLKMEKNN